MFSNFNNINFHIVTFGCQMNKNDSERIYGLLESYGASYVNTIQDADIVIYITCCVREAADVRLYGQASSIKNIPLRKDSPLKQRILAIGGCVGQRDGEKLTNIVKNVNVVFGTNNIFNLIDLISDAIENDKKIVEILKENKKFQTELPVHREKPWAAWLPITIGCNNYCSYCIVPYVRGPEKSRTMEDILQEAYKYKKEGVLELTLLGQNVNSYGRDLYGKPQFYELLKKIDELGFKRLRFATSHPKDISDDVINAFSGLTTLQPALHLPVQSGSEKILKAMNRKYNPKYYLEIIDKLKKVNSDIALSTDIIVGFPGEDEEDFNATYNLVDTVGYHQVFTFIYSKREGTPAAKMHDNTPKEVIQQRFDKLVDLVADKAYELNQKDLGNNIEVLFEGVSKKSPNILVGKSPKNQTVHADLPENCSISDFEGKIVNVKIIQAKTWYLNAKII